MESLRSWKFKRVGGRTSFTKTANVLKAELVKVGFSVDLVCNKFTKLQSVYSDMKFLDEKILDLLAEDWKALESDIANEIENREVYSDYFITLSRQVSERLRISDEIDVEIKSNQGSSVSRDGIKQYRLPKFEMKKFDGELINWLPFWSQFEKIHSGPDLYESDKISFLAQCMKPRPRAREFIESYPVTSENYEKAVLASLKSLGVFRFKVEGKDRMVISHGRIVPYGRHFKGMAKQFAFGQPEENDPSRLANLMKFLKTEVEGEERLKLARWWTR
ncbi:integrase_H2C2 domain-containing protein [Trichonephila clavata]|uniref:Integrase_H2C2 domain-containing protein n=1 Tax=Trichonephila clavata TaxID=2740835 RepID=A0A8X6KAI6_TRICU|nr:integrase_H2C2 domain-containing protein [Trichonephila clavata]